MGVAGAALQRLREQAANELPKLASKRMDVTMAFDPYDDDFFVTDQVGVLCTDVMAIS
jgi:hypothetical protein